MIGPAFVVSASRDDRRGWWRSSDELHELRRAAVEECTVSELTEDAPAPAERSTLASDATHVI
jgi:hypothetical protein